jgi:DNA-binding beta-propeller fold protein YncE
MGTGNDGNIPGFVICFDFILKYIITVTYIPDLLSHSIYKLLTDSNTISAVLSEKEGIHFPTAVAIDRYGKKLYVANNSGNSVKMFAIQTS